MSNTYGTHFRLTTYGESHGPQIGGIIDGCPAGLKVDLDAIQHQLDRRRPGQSRLTTQRKESDIVQFHSGIFEGRTTGTPIGFSIANKDQKSRDYSHIKDIYRPSHADHTYDAKYGIRDYRGGGRSSARETACRVVAGALAKQLMEGITIHAYTASIGEISTSSEVDLSKIDNNDVRCPDPVAAEKMEQLILATKKDGDTVGGTIRCKISGVPAGWGSPVFDKLHSRLGYAMLGINAVKGFEFGSGFAGSRMKGSEHNDAIRPDGTTKTNYSGGVQGGISNGMDIDFHVAFKPVATIMKTQDSIDRQGNAVQVSGKGRHDPCVVPRAIPIVEAMAALTLVDFMLAARLDKTQW